MTVKERRDVVRGKLTHEASRPILSHIRTLKAKVKAIMRVRMMNERGDNSGCNGGIVVIVGVVVVIVLGGGGTRRRDGG